MGDRILFHSTNNKKELVSFENALLNGMASEYGLYMMNKKDLPFFSKKELNSMKNKSYSRIAFDVLKPFLIYDIPENKLQGLLNKAYDPSKINVGLEHIVGKSNIMWLTKGPTYSFKDYAARFFGTTLDYILGKRNERRVVITATSGDTGGAVADALYNLDNVDLIIFYPKGEISENQRRQMTTLGKNVYTFEVNGDFDLCQALAKYFLDNKDFAKEVFDDEKRFTSANSISIGRLLPQTVYPFFAYSRLGDGQSMVASVPSGNFGDMMGTVLAKYMGLPIEKVLCAVNENKTFPNFLSNGNYVADATIRSPSSAMNVSHPSNVARLIEFYGGHMFDERDSSGQVNYRGRIDVMPDLNQMNSDLWSMSVSNDEHYTTIMKFHDKYGIVLDPHGAVSWKALDTYLEGNHDRVLGVVYETADPGKFPEIIEKAIPEMDVKIPEGMTKQAELYERIYSINAEPDKMVGSNGHDKYDLNNVQINEAKEKIKLIFRR